MTPDTLRPLLPLYGLASDATLRVLNRSENTTLLVGEGDGALILRVHRPGYNSRAEIASELSWLSALQGHDGLRCVAPRADSAGGLIHSAGGHDVVAFTPIAARELDPCHDLAPRFSDLGAIAATLHTQARTWPLPEGFTRKRWDLDTILGPQPHWGDWRAASGLEAEGHALLERLTSDLRRRLTGYGTGPKVFGLIHADLRLANLLADDTGLWVIDFDDCGFGWWMFDFAAAISFFETDSRVPNLAAHWMAGYRGRARLSPEDEAMLPVLVLLRRVQLTAWLASRADNDTAAQFGGTEFTIGTLTLAERFLTAGPQGYWKG